MEIRAACAALAAALFGATPAIAQAPAPPATPPPRAAAPSQRPAPPPVVSPKPGPPAQRPPGQRPPAPHASKPRQAAPHPPARAPAPAVAPVPVPEPEKPAAPTKGSNSGLPLPRFAALRSDEVYLRTGPGPRYPIDWVYKRRDLPLEIEREFDIWRLVRDPEGVRGWVNTQTLSPRRTAVVTGAERVLHRDPRDDALPVARLKPGVILRLRTCDAGSDWCQAGVGDYRGWIKRGDVWGTYPGEAIQ